MNFIVLEADEQIGLKLEYDRLCQALLLTLEGGGLERCTVSYDSTLQALRAFHSAQDRLRAKLAQERALSAPVQD